MNMCGGLGQAGRSSLLIAAVLMFGCERAKPESHPLTEFGAAPIIVIDIDTLRADHLGAYGYARATSPALDAFASESTVFEWAFAQGPNTPPSQASIMTGLYPSRHGRISGTDVLTDSAETLAEALKRSGFSTAGFVDGGFMHSRFGMAQGFDTYSDGAEREAPRGVESIGPEVDEWLSAHRDERFLLLVHTYDVHAPYRLTPFPFRNMFLSKLRLPSARFRNSSHAIAEERRKWERRRALGDTPSTDRPVIDSTEMAWLVGLYDGGIRHVDQWFAHLIERLQELGIYDRAIIVVVSDHGEEFDEHDSMDHYAIYSPVARVPMIIRLPKQANGARIGDVVQTVDLMPTLLDLIGVEPAGPLDGRSLAPLLRGQTLPARPAFTESIFSGAQVAVADDAFRLLHSEGPDGDEMFELHSDPLERLNVAAELPEVRERLRERALDYDREVRSLYPPDGAEPTEPLDPELEKQLEALGYLE